MSYQHTAQLLREMNNELQILYEQDEPIKITVSGKPKLHILSFTPLAYERYGPVFNRAPIIAGSLALRAFLYGPGPHGQAYVYAGAETDHAGYGFLMDGKNEATRQTLTDVAEELGFPARLFSGD